MDEDQAEVLGAKMRNAYNDIISETTAVTEDTGKRASRRLRKARNFAKRDTRRAAAKTASAGGSFMSHHPVASLLIASGVGYLLARAVRL